MTGIRNLVGEFRRLFRQVESAAWGSPLRRIVTTLVGLIGFAASIAGLWPLLFPEQPDATIKLLPGIATTIVFDVHAKTLPTPPTVIGGTIVVDGIKLEAPDGALFAANKISLLNGGIIHGINFAIVAPIIQGGQLDASGASGAPGNADTRPNPTRGQNAGRIFIATAVLEGTAIRVDAGNGGKGKDGLNGPAKLHASDGQNGDCGGFGAYRGAQRGADGAQGNPGEAGQDGAAGGNAGSIVLLLSASAPPPDISAKTGQGGKRGEGGHGGDGQEGGKGGAGCTGLGGSQPNQPDGHAGPRGAEGKHGETGADGRDGSVTIQHVHFRDVAAAWRRAPGQPISALDSIGALPTAD